MKEYISLKGSDGKILKNKEGEPTRILVPKLKKINDGEFTPIEIFEMWGRDGRKRMIPFFPQVTEGSGLISGETLTKFTSQSCGMSPKIIASLPWQQTEPQSPYYDLSFLNVDETGL